MILSQVTLDLNLDWIRPTSASRLRLFEIRSHHGGGVPGRNVTSPGQEQVCSRLDACGKLF